MNIELPAFPSSVRQSEPTPRKQTAIPTGIAAAFGLSVALVVASLAGDSWGPPVGEHLMRVSRRVDPVSWRDWVLGAAILCHYAKHWLWAIGGLQFFASACYAAHIYHLEDICRTRGLQLRFVHVTSSLNDVAAGLCCMCGGAVGGLIVLGSYGTRFSFPYRSNRARFAMLCILLHAALIYFFLGQVTQLARRNMERRAAAALEFENSREGYRARMESMPVTEDPEVWVTGTETPPE